MTKERQRIKIAEAFAEQWGNEIFQLNE